MSNMQLDTNDLEELLLVAICRFCKENDFTYNINYKGEYLEHKGLLFVVNDRGTWQHFGCMVDRNTNGALVPPVFTISTPSKKLYESFCAYIKENFNIESKPYER